jgi:signal transduction histidine kinase
MRIRAKLSFWFIVASFLPAVIITVFAATEAGRRFTARAREAMSRSEESVYESLARMRTDIAERLKSALERAGEAIGRFSEANVPDKEASDLAVSLNSELALDFDHLDFLGPEGFVYSSLSRKYLVGKNDPQWDDISGLRHDSVVVGPARLIGADSFRDRLAVRAVMRHKGVMVIGGRDLNKDFLKQVRLAPGARLFLVDRIAGEVVGETGDDEDRRVAAELLGLTGSGVAIEESAALSLMAGSFFIRTVPLQEGLDAEEGEGHSPGEIIILYPRNELDESISGLLTTFLLASAVGIALALLLGLIISKRVAKPLRQLNYAFELLALGDFSQRLRVRRRDELGELTGAFNRMAEDLGSLQNRLVRAERVAAWQEVARKVAHEIKNPLSPIQVSIETLIKVHEREHPDFDQIFSESTAMILEEVEKIRRIVAEFSDFARMPEPQFEAVDLHAAVSKVLALCRPKFGGVRLREQLENTPIVRADPEHLHRLLMNLVLNALEALEGAGTLVIGADRPAEDGGRFLRIVIRDDGPGMTQEVQERLFTPYFTTKPEGTGLGLIIAQRIVEQHSGRISLFSEPGRGTVVEVLLPSA